MAIEALRVRIRDLFIETGTAHHEAFASTDGVDPDWPIWYADYLEDKINALLGATLTRSQLIYCLMFVEFERQAKAPDAAWHGYYADHLIERFAPPEAPADDRLALYYFPTCPFCIRVLMTIKLMKIDVELRNIRTSDEHWDALVAARGRATVPVLRIMTADGEDRWMPESSDIVRYLKRTYSDAA
jgi:glutaredoxin